MHKQDWRLKRKKVTVSQSRYGGVSDKEVKEVMLYLKKGAEEKKSIKRDWAADLKNSIKGNVDLTIGEENYFDKITSKELKKFAQQLFSQKNRMTFIFAPEN